MNEANSVDTRLALLHKIAALRCLADLNTVMSGAFMGWLDGVGNPNDQVVSLLVAVREACVYVRALILADDDAARRETGGG